MISGACKLFLQAELNNLGIGYNYIHLGEIELSMNINKEQHEALKIDPEKYGFEMIENRKEILL